MLSPLKHQPRRTTPTRAPRSRCRPGLETLDDRCLLSAGALDPNFGSGGVVTTTIGSSTSWNGATAVAVYPNAGTANDGDVVAVGHAVTGTHSGFPVNNFAVIRYLPNGALDPSFGNGGIVTTDVSSTGSQASDVAIQPDGKIVVAGFSKDASGDLAFTVVRYNVTGSLDTTFGNGKTAGIVQTHMSRGSNDSINSMALQPDGKIVVEGVTTPQGSTTGQLAIVRYNSNGSLDTNFNRSGMIITPGPGANDLAIYPSTSGANAGRIVVAGLLRNADGTDSVEVRRYNSTGSIDTTFGGGTGYVLLNTLSNPIPGLDSSPYVAIQADGNLDIAFTVDNGTLIGNVYNGTSEMAVVQIKAVDGSMDPSFGNGGVVVTQHQMWDTAMSIALQTDGAIVVGGKEGGTVSPNRTFVVARFNPTDGSLDTTFGAGGFQTAPVQLQNGYGVDMAIQPDGKIVMAGTQTVNTTNGYADLAFALARFLPSEPQIGSFTASAASVATGSNLTLTASSITDANPGATISQVTFYADQSGTEIALGTVTQTSPGVWTCTFTVGLAPGTYTLIAQAQDSDGVFGEPSAISLTVV